MMQQGDAIGVYKDSNRYQSNISRQLLEAIRELESMQKKRKEEQNNATKATPRSEEWAE